MIFTNTQTALRISFAENLLDELLHIGKNHYPNEFGGFLIGYYSNDNKQLNITDHILPKNYKGSQYLFERSNFGIATELRAFFSETPPKYYVGEWHTHPDGMPMPSCIDIDAMKSIATHKDVAILNPALLIIGKGYNRNNLGIFAFFNNKLNKYE